MKKFRKAIPLIAFAWIVVAVAAAWAAKDRTALGSKPLVVRGNDRIIFPKESRNDTTFLTPNDIPANAERSIHYQSFSGGPTNLNLQTYFVEVAKVSSSYWLSNSVAVTTTNYLDSDPDWFNGATNVPLNTNAECWQSVSFQVNGYAMSSNNISDAALLFVGSTETVGTNFDTGYAFAVQNRIAGATNFWFPVGSSAETANQPGFQTGVEESLMILNGGMTNSINTNFILKAYLAQTVQDTNGAYRLTNISANLTPTWFETNNTNYYKGGNIALQSSGTTTVLFKLKSQKFTDEAIPDCYLVFVGVSTNTNTRCQVAYVYPIDSPYSPPAAKKSEKPKAPEKPKKDKE